jgi:hypothetical protein
MTDQFKKDMGSWSSIIQEGITSIIIDLHRNKEESLKRVLLHLGLPIEESTWRRITSVKREGSDKECFYLDYQTENELMLLRAWIDYDETMQGESSPHIQAVLKVEFNDSFGFSTTQ